MDLKPETLWPVNILLPTCVEALSRPTLHIFEAYWISNDSHYQWTTYLCLFSPKAVTMTSSQRWIAQALVWVRTQPWLVNLSSFWEGVCRLWCCSQIWGRWSSAKDERRGRASTRSAMARTWIQYVSYQKTMSIRRKFCRFDHWIPNFSFK